MTQMTAIIPAFGHEEMTRRAVLRLREQTAPPAETIVVDDGSATAFGPIEGARVLHHEANRGFAAAVNTGLRACRTDRVAILNNDVTLAANWLELMDSVLSADGADFACGKLYRPDGRLDGTFDLLSRGGLAWRAGAGREDGPLFSRRQTILFTSFTAVAGTAAGFLEGGGLDESYHSYYEDVEWSLRAALAGKRGVFEPSATGIHTGSATSGAWSSYSARQLLRNHRRLAQQYLLPEYRREYLAGRLLLRLHALRNGQCPILPAETVEAKPRGARLAAILAESERQLWALQQETGPDRLWAWYFRLAGGHG